MHKDVFPKKEFLTYAAKKLVLVEVDFPERKKQPDALKKANEALEKQFKIEGYPTLLLFDGGGKKLGEVELATEVKALIANIEKLAAKK